MAKQIETIWSYLQEQGFECVPRPAKKTVHLALESEKLNSAQKKRMTDVWETSEKLDGVYSLVTLIPQIGQGYEVRHWGRSGKALENCGVLDSYIKHQFIPSPDLTPKILISEITADGPLAKLSGYLTPTRVKESLFEPQNFQDNFHEILDVEEFIEGTSAMRRVARYVALQRFLMETNLVVLPRTYFRFDEALAHAKDIIYPKGGEGLILRDPDAYWDAGARNETMIKIKEKLSYDVTVIGVCSGKEGSKYENTLGKLLVAFRAFGKPDGEWLVVPISGMTDANRDIWWVHHEHIIGACVKMDAKSFTENGNLREPRYKEIRHDKSSQFPVEVWARSLETIKSKSKHITYEWYPL